jgi:hypothetical protein
MALRRVKPTTPCLRTHSLSRAGSKSSDLLLSGEEVRGGGESHSVPLEEVDDALPKLFHAREDSSSRGEHRGWKLVQRLVRWQCTAPHATCRQVSNDTVYTLGCSLQAGLIIAGGGNDSASVTPSTMAAGLTFVATLDQFSTTDVADPGEQLQREHRRPREHEATIVTIS